MSTGQNAQRKDILVSNLAVTGNVVVGKKLVANQLEILQSLALPRLTVDALKLVKGPLAAGNILTSDASGNATWEPPTSVSGVVTGSGTTNQLVQWTDGPNSDIGNALISVSSATLSPIGVDFGISAPSTAVNITSGEAASDAVNIVASNAAGGIVLTSGTGNVTVNTTGGFTASAAAPSGLNTSVGTLSIQATQATAGGVVQIASEGTSTSAIELLATSGGMRMLYSSTNNLVVAPIGGTVATFGTLAAPDLTLASGHLVLSSATRGIKNGPTNGTISGNVVVVNGITGTILDEAVVAPGSRTAIAVTNSAVAATSQIFIQVVNDATSAQSASLLTNVVAGAGSFTLNVFNTDGANSTTNPPSYNYWIVNPV